MMKNLGPMVFIVGILVSLLVGGLGFQEPAVYVLLVLGVLVGILNIQEEEVVKYLVSIVALLFSSAELYRLFELLPFGLGSVLGNVLRALVVFLSSAAAVVALRVLIELARD